MSAPLTKGQQFWAPTMGCYLTVTRVAKDESWADIQVTASVTHASWSKRQPLDRGRFPFPVVAR